MLTREGIVQSPWVQPEQGLQRRDFEYEIDLANKPGESPTITLSRRILTLLASYR